MWIDLQTILRNDDIPNDEGGVIIKTVSKLDISLFTESEKYVSIGRIRPDIIASETERFPGFTERLSPGVDILFWTDRIKHIERHRKDFASSEEYDYCFNHIPDIIKAPD